MELDSRRRAGASAAAVPCPWPDPRDRGIAAAWCDGPPRRALRAGGRRPRHGGGRNHALRCSDDVSPAGRRLRAGPGARTRTGRRPHPRLGFRAAAGPGACAPRTPDRPAHRRTSWAHRDAHGLRRTQRRRSQSRVRGPGPCGRRRSTSRRSGQPVTAYDDVTIGQIAVRSPSMFDGYLDSPKRRRRSCAASGSSPATSRRWRRIGICASWASFDGSHQDRRIPGGCGRGGVALLEHPAVIEAAVAGRADDDLGERISAWVVVREGAAVSEDELIDHVRQLLSAHKRPREVHVVDRLPRNAMGKVQKAQL